MLLMNYYDGILLVIPSLMIMGGGISFVFELSLQATVIAVSVLSVAVVGHGMFINPPVDPTEVISEESSTNENTINSDPVSAED